MVFDEMGMGLGVELGGWGWIGRLGFVVERVFRG